LFGPRRCRFGCNKPIRMVSGLSELLGQRRREEETGAGCRALGRKTCMADTVPVRCISNKMPSTCQTRLFFIFIIKKTKFLKYTPNRKFFKNGCPYLRPPSVHARPSNGPVSLPQLISRLVLFHLKFQNFTKFHIILNI